MSNDTQHYTNFEIFHSLVPKMKAAFPNINNWDELDKKENYDDYRYILIDTNVKGNIKKGDKIVYLGTGHGFLYDEVWPSRVATGVVDDIDDCGCIVRWDNPIVVGKRYKGRTHVWYEDIAKVIPWD